MATRPKLYDRTVLVGPSNKLSPVTSKTYKGFSTISPDTNTFSLYDFALIKQDIINHFHIRQGEKLENPTFGTIIWDLLFEPLVEEVKELIIRDVETIINYDPRVKAQDVIVTTYETGIQIECSVTYLLYNVREQMKFRFDQSNGLLT